jgi:DNA-binding response OmpR family regulator
LALFVLNAGDVVSSSRLADELWSGSPPKSASTTLQTFVYQLRRRYGIEETRGTHAVQVVRTYPAKRPPFPFAPAAPADLLTDHKRS